MKYIETRHVLDITNLPEPLRSKAYEFFSDQKSGQDSFISYDVGDPDFGMPELDALIKEHHPDITSFVVHYWW